MKTPLNERITNGAIIAGLVAYFAAIVTVFFKQPELTALLVLPAPVILVFRFKERKKALILAATGLVIGPATEIICIISGLWSYATPGILPYVPLWLFPGWACFPLALTLLTEAFLGHSFEFPAHGWLIPLALLGLAIEITIFAVLGNHWLYPILAILPFLPLLWFSIRLWETPILLLLGALIGPVAECVPIAAGAWTYAIREILGIPYYMLPAYGLFAVLTINLGHGLNARFRKRNIPAKP